MQNLLELAAINNIEPAYVHKILENSSGDFHSQSQSSVEQLSGRELEVLRLLPTKLTAPEIADQLYIAESTVRTHIKHIYSKLNVNRRFEAVERAKELGLL